MNTELAYDAADAERRVTEVAKAGDIRDAWEIDRARILHSAAFRRLQGKTQVFAPGDGDMFRTRLTHSLEVSQIAKSIALRVGANPTLCEAASLAHDIGHPPFGHAGETVLNTCMEQHGGFEGNAQNLRVVASLEVKSAAYEGLNLTRATLDALLKYKRPHRQAHRRGPGKFYYDDDAALVHWVCGDGTDEATSFECQIMDWADDVAYSVHDVEDGLASGIVTTRRLRSAATRAAVRRAVPAVTPADLDRILHELDELLEATSDRSSRALRKTWSSYKINELVQAVQAAPRPTRGHSSARYTWQLVVEPRGRLQSQVLKALAQHLVFEHPRIARVPAKAARIVGGLFERLTSGPPDLLPPSAQEQLAAGTGLQRVVADHIAGLTDAQATTLQRRLNR